MRKYLVVKGLFNFKNKTKIRKSTKLKPDKAGAFNPKFATNLAGA
jgi:hypothetical protein